VLSRGRCDVSEPAGGDFALHKVAGLVMAVA
jgi:hypothetical protein